MTDFRGKLHFSLIVCTYSRPHSLIRLLDSVGKQSLYPNEILIIDASEDNITKQLVSSKDYCSLFYFKVDEANKGLTKQRNFGINKTSEASEIICFLDDDIILEQDYFKNLIGTYKLRPDAIAAGGSIKDEVEWIKVRNNYKPKFEEFLMDGLLRKLGNRNVLRKHFSLLSNKPPGIMPEFSHGLSTAFLPPSGKIYSVEFFMGGVSSYKKDIFNEISFSKYFEGYGLYEDMDFCLRASKIGKLYVNTNANVYHLHEEAGRPNYIKYGKMVVRNGFYVWKLKNPDPKFKSVLKWNAITCLLILVRFCNYLSLRKGKGAFEDALGRTLGWLSLIYDRPRIL